MDRYQFLVYRHSEARQYSTGEAVYVWLKSQYSTGRATVLATPEAVPADSPFGGRYLVRFTACGSTAHVRPERLLPVYQQQHALQQATAQLPLPPAQQQQQQQEPVAGVQQEQELQHALQQLRLPCAAPQQAPTSASQHHHHNQVPPQQQQFQQQQQGGLVLLVYSTVDYRRMARSQVQAFDGVLELGCSYGVCSRMLQEHAAWLKAVDNSDEMIQEARKRNPNISFHQMDVLEQQSQLLQLAGCQVSCSDETISTNGSSSAPPSTAAADSNNSRTDARTAAGAGSAACSCGLQLGGPPCSVVFADIGGNRQLESLVKLVPWVLRAMRPRLLVVKSEELTAAAEQQVAVEQQQQLLVQHHQHQQQVKRSYHQEAGQQEQSPQPQLASLFQAQAITVPAAAAMSVQLGVPSLKQIDGVIRDVAGWWKQLELRCGNPASLAEPWFMAARAAGFSRNPMRYPQRCTADGTRICRPHNYDKERGCLKREGCPFDHVHCHHCLKAGHRAVECAVV